MKVSHAWLQTYFDKPLPDASELAELLTFHAFEIEGVEQVGEDSTIDVDVLSNRSSDCLCHRGIAKELAVLLSRTDEFNANDPFTKLLDISAQGGIEIRIDAPELINRFSVARVQGVKVGPSPAWLSARLEAIGQRSINNIVDATNYVMFAIGQPLHAFDASKLSGDAKTLAVRLAKKSEKITTLTNDTYTLDVSNLLIVDGNDDTPLAIAGIKGGKHAEVDTSTTDLVIEAANFNYVSVRKTSRALKLQTDASVRFQNQPVHALTAYALREVVTLIAEIAGGTQTGSADWCPSPQVHESVSVSGTGITHSLGVELSGKEVEAILARFGWDYVVAGDAYTVTPPIERTDIVYKEDLIEEIGRVHGYGDLAPRALESGRTESATNKLWQIAEHIRRTLVTLGYSEVLTYQLRDTGELALTNSLASDKDHIRANLTDGMREALEKNAYYAPLLGLEQVRLFEIGIVWKDGGEQVALAIGVHLTKKVKGQNADTVIAETLQTLSEHVSGIETHVSKEGVVEIALAQLVAGASVPESHESVMTGSDVRYTPFSVYPFILRDIAFWTPATDETQNEKLKAIIIEQGGGLLVRADLFDEFSKEGRTSYAYHLVFQSKDRTLTDEEVGAIMANIVEALEALHCEIR